MKTFCSFFVKIAFMNSDVSTSFQNFFLSLDYKRNPLALYLPIEYTLEGGGKRLRPQLLILSYLLFKDNPSDVFNVAAGMEIFHNFTLLHDDVMDNADMRRSKPTVHKRWNSNVAILSGDAMQILAYRYLSMAPAQYSKEIIELATETFLQIIEGQQYDMDFESRGDVTPEEYMEMIKLKTSVLLAACMKMGGVLGGASAEECDILYNIGINVGLAFQLQDDMLDVYGDPVTFGKQIGGDICCNKKTYMYINARKMASPQILADLDKWELWSGNRNAKIQAVTEIYNKLGIKEICKQKSDSLFKCALSLFDKLNVPSERKCVLKQFVESMINREK